MASGHGKHGCGFGAQSAFAERNGLKARRFCHLHLLIAEIAFRTNHNHGVGARAIRLREQSALMARERCIAICNEFIALKRHLHHLFKRGELMKPGRDPRDELPKPLLRTDVMGIDDLTEGMVLDGTVRNVIDFGAFVDIGVHLDGLVHISEMSDRFIRHPSEVVKVGDIVSVRVMGVDKKKNRISLSMKAPKGK